MSALPSEPVAIVGAGIVTGLGHGMAAHTEALAAGARAVTALAPEGPARFGATVPAPDLRAEIPAELVSQVKFLSGSGRLAAEAAHQAWTDRADRLPELPPSPRRGLQLAQGDAFDWDGHTFQPGYVAGQTPGEPMDPVAVNKAATRRTKPYFLLESLKNNAFSFVTAWFGMQGANTSVAGLGHAGFHALDLARRCVLRGDADLMMALGGSRTTQDVARAEFHRMGHVANDGEGFVPGDGAGALVLSATSAGTPWGHLLATVAGSGPIHEGGATADGLDACARDALAEAQVEDVAVLAGLSGTRLAAHTTSLGLPAARCLDLRRATGHLGVGQEVCDAAMLLGHLAPGETGLLLSEGLRGQAGAIVLRRA